ncbi:threonine aldolase family protein [Clostridium tyrobutyricum]|uniref:threonine aldolase family protein n=1 Tax=Clostridium tyrobutyricum TaxID=1519 RepID=UPI00057DC828|nr:beta-eliminating lyase-related protein [Clostridium tyrobutyricum]
MIYFQCDYVEGGHPKILERMMSTNMEQAPGYGNDSYCESAKKRIRTACGKENADVHFLVGGTQTNLTVISSILRPYQGVLTADEGHITCHETGAIEATGHKVLPLSTTDGTITGQQVRDYCREHFTCEICEHTVQPGMVYISFPTESGSLYNKKQLTELSEACHACGIPLYLDGARLGYGMMSPCNDLTLQDISELCDIFYIGGTKCGALFGEAVVIVNESLKKDFRYCIKQRGGMLAKGRLLGIQFDVLFENNLYFGICKQAIDYAFAIRKAFEEKGVQLYGNSQTNQQFPILTNEQLSVFDGKYAYEVWGKYDDTHTIVRFCTSWATTEENVKALLKDIKTL